MEECQSGWLEQSWKLSNVHAFRGFESHLLLHLKSHLLRWLFWWTWIVDVLRTHTRLCLVIGVLVQSRWQEWLVWYFFVKSACCLSFSGRKLFNYGIIKLIFLALYLHFNCSHFHFIFNSLQQFDILRLVWYFTVIWNYYWTYFDTMVGSRVPIFYLQR